MTGYAIACGGILAAGVYLRFSVGPVLLAYEIGKRIGRIRARRGGPATPRTPAAMSRHLARFLCWRRYRRFRAALVADARKTGRPASDEKLEADAWLAARATGRR